MRVDHLWEKVALRMRRRVLVGIVLIMLLSTVVARPVAAEEPITLPDLIPPITATMKLSGCWTLVAKVGVQVTIEGVEKIFFELAPREIAFVCVKGERTVTFTFFPDGVGGGTISYSNSLPNSSFEINYTNSGGESTIWLFLSWNF